MEGEHQSELQWREGIVYNPASSYDETWNDQEILDVFDAAIKSHRSKGKKKDPQPKKEIRSPKNVHFATSHDENILFDPLDEELPPSLTTNTRWQEESTHGELGEDSISLTSRLPRVNFDLESGVSVVPESVTHTDTEGSDGGNGAGSDSSASINRRTQNSSRRRTQSTLKKKQQQESEPIVEAVPTASVQQTQAPLQQPIPQPAVLPQATHAYPQIPPPLPTPPLPFLSSAPSHVFSTPSVTPSAQPSTMHPFQSSSGHVAPEMECLLTDMLMAWYQSGYTTGRYYSMLEQQQQQMNQWYAYYHQQTNPSSQSPPQAYHPSQQQSDSFGKS